MNNKNLILILLAAAGAGYFLLKRKKNTESGDIIEPTASGAFELPPGTLTQGRGGIVAPSPVVPFAEPVATFLPPSSSNLKPPTNLTAMPQTSEELTIIADDILAKWRRWKMLLDTPIINGSINDDYTTTGGSQQLNPIYKISTQRTALNTPVPNIALIPNLQSWFWNNTAKVWQIMTRTA